MPYDWTTGKYTATVPPLSFGARQPNTIGTSSYLPGGGPKPPVYPQRRVGPNGMLVPVDPKATAGLGHPTFLDSLYPKKKGTTGKTPYVDPWQKIINQLQGYFETPAQQEARVNREIDQQIALQKKMLDDDYARQQANARALAAGQEAAGQAAAAMSKDLFGSVGGEFNAAAGEIKGLAHSLSGNANATTKGEMKGANAALGAAGNEDVSTGGSFGIGGDVQAGVENYRGGTLAGQMFGTQGEAANFGLAGMLSSEQMKAHEEAQAALITTSREINDAQSKAIQSLAAGRADLFHTYMNDAKDSQIKYISLVQGLMADRASSVGSAAKVPTTRLFGNVYKQWVPGQGWVPIDKKAAKPAAVKTFKGTDGRTYVLHPNGTASLVAGQSAPKPTGGTPYRTKINGRVWEMGADGVMHLVPGQPAGGTTTTKKGQLTDLQIKNMVEFWKGGKPGKLGTVPWVIGKRNDGSPIIAQLKPGQKYALVTDVGKNKKGAILTVPADIAQRTGGVQGRTYQQALKTLMGFGVDPMKAKTILDTYWKRGQGTRPYLDATQRDVLLKAGTRGTVRHLTQRQIDSLLESRPELDPDVNPKAQTGHGYITLTQLRALQKAGVPPPAGDWVMIQDPKTRNLVRVLLIRETFG